MDLLRGGLGGKVKLREANREERQYLLEIKQTGYEAIAVVSVRATSSTMNLLCGYDTVLARMMSQEASSSRLFAGHHSRPPGAESGRVSRTTPPLSGVG